MLCCQWQMFHPIMHATQLVKEHPTREIRTKAFQVNLIRCHYRNQVSYKSNKMRQLPPESYQNCESQALRATLERLLTNLLLTLGAETLEVKTVSVVRLAFPRFKAITECQIMAVFIKSYQLREKETSSQVGQLITIKTISRRRSISRKMFIRLLPRMMFKEKV